MPIKKRLKQVCNIFYQVIHKAKKLHWQKFSEREETAEVGEIQ